MSSSQVGDGDSPILPDPILQNSMALGNAICTSAAVANAMAYPSPGSKIQEDVLLVDTSRYQEVCDGQAHILLSHQDRTCLAAILQAILSPTQPSFTVRNVGIAMKVGRGSQQVRLGDPDSNAKQVGCATMLVASS